MQGAGGAAGGVPERKVLLCRGVGVYDHAGFLGRRAQEVLREAFPERKVVAVPTRDVLLGGGNIHCITQQQPAQHVQG